MPLIPKKIIPDWDSRLSFLPQKGAFWGLRGNPYLSPSDSKRWAQLKDIMVHLSLGQVLIRQGWKASLPGVGLSKTLRIRPVPCAVNFKEDNT